MQMQIAGSPMNECGHERIAKLARQSYAVIQHKPISQACRNKLSRLCRRENVAPSKDSRNDHVFGSSGNLVGTSVAVFNHGKHRRPHSRDTEGSMKETFGQLADVCPASMCQDFGIIN